jgi:hypothetical protein
MRRVLRAKPERRLLTIMANAHSSDKHARREVPDSSERSPRPAAAVGEGWFSKVSQYLGLYVIYVFLSGWAFGDFYLRDLGLSPRWLDLSLSDVLVSGFTILFTGGKWLWPFYLMVLLIPILVEVSSWGNRASVRVVSTILLVALLFPIYLISRTAGVQQARIDKSANSRLPVVTFSSKDGKKYVGKLLYLKSGTYFIREVRAIDSPDADDASSGLTLSIYRAEEVQDVRVVGFP